MHRNRRPLALLSLVSLMAALALSFVQNVELDGRGENDGIAQLGIEGEGDIPLPIAEQA